MKAKLMGLLAAVTSGMIYGVLPFLAKSVYAAGGNSFTLVFLRMVIGAVVFSLLHRITSADSLAVGRKERKKLGLCALGYGVTPLLLYLSYRYIASGLATTLHFVYPVFVVAGCALFKTARLTGRKLLCSLLCMTGIALFYTPGGAVDPRGVLIALASGMVYACYSVSLEATGLLAMEPYKLAFWVHLLSALLAGGCALLFGQLAWPSGGAGWLAVFALGILAAAASFLYQLATRLAGAQNTALLSTLEPLTSIAVGVFVLSEALPGQNILGIVCILFSVVILSTGVKKRERERGS